MKFGYVSTSYSKRSLKRAWITVCLQSGFAVLICALSLLLVAMEAYFLAKERRLSSPPSHSSSLPRPLQ